MYSNSSPRSPILRALGGLAGNFGWPILQRQLRADFRKSRFFVSQFICVCALAAVLVGFVVTLTEDESFTAPQIGQYVFSAFFGLQYLIVCVVFPAFSSTAFTEERGTGTMDLLLTTGLRPGEIVWGKFLASSIYCFIYVFASIPILSIAFLFGGVTPVEVLVAYGILIGLTVLVCMLGVTVSSCFSANIRATLSVYAVMAAILGASFWVYSDVEAIIVDAETPTSMMAALLDYLGFAGPSSTLRLAFVLFLCCAAFAYLFLYAANRLRPSSHDRSSAVRALTLLVSMAILAFQVAAYRWGPAGAAKATEAAESFVGVLPVWFAILLLIAVAFPTEEADVSRRVRGQVRGLRGLLYPARLLSPGAFWGWTYSVVLSGLVCGLLYLGAFPMIASGASPAQRLLVAGSLATIPFYTAFIASVGFFLTSSGFAPLYSRLTVFFLFLITLLLPAIFMFSEIPDRWWTLYFISPWTLWESLQTDLSDRPPSFVLFGFSVVQIARPLFAFLTTTLVAASLWFCRKKGYPTLRS